MTMKILRSNRGMVQVYVFSMLAIFLMTGLSLLGLQNSSLSDYYDMKANSQARFLASSAIQEGKYFVMRMNANFLGTSGEQTVEVENKGIGTYEYTIARIGQRYTITGRGYVPNKAARHKMTYTLSSQFTYDYIGVGVVLLSQNGSGALNLQGNGRLNILGGKLLVNSTHATGTIVGGNARLTAPSIGLAGGYATSSNGQVIGTVTTNMAPVSDPLAHLPVPDPVNLGLATQSSSRLNITGNQTLQPGVYQGGIAISSNANVTLAPGIYYIQGGGLSVSGNANLAGNGVFIYNLPSTSSDSINLGGNGIINIRSQTAGDYANVAIFQARTTTAPATIGGNGMVTVGGNLYMPDAALTMHGNSRGTTLGSLHIAAQMTIDGNGTVTVNDDTP